MEETAVIEDRETWQLRLEEAERRLGYSDGFKLLFCPWDRLSHADTVFLSLNPGNDPSGEHMRVASDERGNSYLVERAAQHSPIAEQYRRLCALIGKDPETVLAGALMPFRTPSWIESRDNPNISIAASFWRSVVTDGPIREVFCIGKTVESAMTLLTGASQVSERPAGWGAIRIRRHETTDGLRLYGLPHLSRFKLLGRPDSEAALRALIDEA